MSFHSVLFSLLLNTHFSLMYLFRANEILDCSGIVITFTCWCVTIGVRIYVHININRQLSVAQSPWDQGKIPGIKSLSFQDFRIFQVVMIKPFILVLTLCMCFNNHSGFFPQLKTDLDVLKTK